MLTYHVIIKTNVIQNHICKKEKVVSFSKLIDVVIEFEIMSFLHKDLTIMSYTLIRNILHGRQQLLQFRIFLKAAFRVQETRINIQEVAN